MKTKIGKSEKHKRVANCTSLAELAAQLSRHFEGRLSIDLCGPVLCQWKRGRGLPRGTPLPPAKTGNVHPTAKWVKWIETWILPKYGTMNGAQAEDSVFMLAERAKAQRAIDESVTASLKRKSIEGAFISKEQHLNEVRNIGQLLNHAITRFVEKEMAESITEAVKDLVDESKRESLAESIRLACQNAADALRDALAKALREETDKPQELSARFISSPCGDIGRPGSAASPSGVIPSPAVETPVRA